MEEVGAGVRAGAGARALGGAGKLKDVTIKINPTGFSGNLPLNPVSDLGLSKIAHLVLGWRNSYPAFSISHQKNGRRTYSFF